MSCDQRKVLAGPCGQEEPLLAFRTGKYALHGHSPTSQPGNGSRESQGKTSRQSGRGERKIRSRIIIFCAVLFIVLLFYSFIYSLYLFAIHSYTCETWLAFVLKEMEREKENISRLKAGREICIHIRSQQCKLPFTIPKYDTFLD